METKMTMNMSGRFTSDRGDAWDWSGPADASGWGSMPEAVQKAVMRGAVVTDHLRREVYRDQGDGSYNVMPLD